MSELKSELIFEMNIAVGEMHTAGDAGGGSRWIAGQTGGSFKGPHLAGQVQDPGGDFGLRRADGVTEHDIRAVLRTDDGAVIYMRYEGLGHRLPLLPDQVQAEDTPFYFRVAVRFETGAEKYGWLNRVLAVGVPQRPESKEYHISWRIYAIL